MSDFDVNVPFLSPFSCAVLGVLIYVYMHVYISFYITNLEDLKQIVLVTRPEIEVLD